MYDLFLDAAKIEIEKEAIEILKTVNIIKENLNNEIKTNRELIDKLTNSIFNGLKILNERIETIEKALGEKNIH